LTGVSIDLGNMLLKQMDCRVKPGNDGVIAAAAPQGHPP
jgi:hypothetical protein